MKLFLRFLPVTAIAVLLPSALQAEVQPLEGEQMEEVYIPTSSVTTVRSTPIVSAEKPSVGDIQRQTSSSAISRDLSESLSGYRNLPPVGNPNFQQRLMSRLQEQGLISGDDAQLILNQVPSGATVSGTNGNYTVNTSTDPNRNIGLQTSPAGLTITLPNTGNFPNEIQGSLDSGVRMEVRDNQIILQLNPQQ